MVSFLHVTLLEQTTWLRRWVRDASLISTAKPPARCSKKQTDSSVDLRAERVELKEVLYDKEIDRRANRRSDARAGAAKRAQLRWHAGPIGPRSTGEGRSTVSPALLNSLGILEIRGEGVGQGAEAAEVAARPLAKAGATSLPEELDVSFADPGWHLLLQRPDRKLLLH